MKGNDEKIAETEMGISERKLKKGHLGIKV